MNEGDSHLSCFATWQVKSNNDKVLNFDEELRDLQSFESPVQVYKTKHKATTS